MAELKQIKCPNCANPDFNEVKCEYCGSRFENEITVEYRNQEGEIFMTEVITPLQRKTKGTIHTGPR